MIKEAEDLLAHNKQWDHPTNILEQLADVLQENKILRMRLAQIASGDYKICGHSAEEVAADALQPNKESDIHNPYCIHGVYTGNSEQCPRCLDSLNQPKT